MTSAIAVLSVVTTMVQTGDTTPAILDITFLVLKILGLFADFGWFGCYYSKNTSCREIMAFRGKRRRYYYAAFFGAAGIAAL